MIIIKVQGIFGYQVLVFSVSVVVTGKVSFEVIRSEAWKIVGGDYNTMENKESCPQQQSNFCHQRSIASYSTDNCSKNQQ